MSKKVKKMADGGETDDMVTTMSVGSPAPTATATKSKSSYSRNGRISPHVQNAQKKNFSDSMPAKWNAMFESMKQRAAAKAAQPPQPPVDLNNRRGSFKDAMEKRMAMKRSPVAQTLPAPVNNDSQKAVENAKKIAQNTMMQNRPMRPMPPNQIAPNAGSKPMRPMPSAAPAGLRSLIQNAGTAPRPPSAPIAVKKGGNVKKYANGGKISLNSCGVSTASKSKKSPSW